MQDRNTQFHLAEYAALREEVLLAIKNSQNGVFLSLIANAGLVSWLTTQSTIEKISITLMPVAAWLPLFISILAIVYYGQRVSQMHRATDYIFTLEKELAAEGLGWQHYLLEKNKRRYTIFRTRTLNYFLLLVQTALALYFGLRAGTSLFS